MSYFLNTLSLALVLLVCLGSGPFGSSGVYARRVNITYLDNCQDEASQTVFVRDVTFHEMEDGTRDIVHCNMEVTTDYKEAYLLLMTLYKCKDMDTTKPCLDEPTEHEEILDCDRMVNDDTGPWHMLTSALEEGGKCGDQVGMFSMSFARLRLEYLMKYLDVYDTGYNSFRLKMNFKEEISKQTRGCGYLDFSLLPV